MKTLVTLLFMFASVLAMGQQSEKILVDTKDLPPDVVQQLKQKQQSQEIKSTLENYSEFAGLGKEIGVAVKEGLTAVKDVAVDFSQTDVGTFTMVLIAWSIVGDDLIGFIGGTSLFLIGTVILIWSYRRTCIPHKVCIEDPGWFRYPKKYTITKPMYDDGGGAMLHLVAWGIIIAVSTAIIF